MKKFILPAVAIFALVIIVLAVTSSNTSTYVSDVTNEVVALETELQTLEAEIDFETITPEEAVEKQAVIVAKLERIQSLVDNAPKDSLSKAKYAELQASLQRLAGTLQDYSDSLIQLDTVAEGATQEVKERAFGRTANGRSIRQVVHNVIADTIETVEEHLEEITDEPLDEEITDAVNEAIDIVEENIETIEEMLDESGTSTDEMDDDSSGAAGTMPEGTDGDWTDTPMDGSDEPEEMDSSEEETQ